ncbi:MAG: phosphatase PAP2 family protein [Candidatus Eremiobacteraeota bacterium]|nr:phosphatase PAP2 family protein [Candidatus Eremiobacteraeota bacterium]
MSRLVFYLGFVLSLVSLLCFGDIGEDMTDDGWADLERTFSDPIRAWRGPWLNQLMRGLTWLGSFWCLAAVVAAVLLWPGSRFGVRDKSVFLGLGLSEGTLNSFLKFWYGRPRPGADYAPMVEEKYFSFPSGHSMGSLCVYGFLAYLLCRHYPRWRWPVRLGTLALVVTVGVSRIYLAAHYPGDVVGGFAAGIPCLFLALVIHQGLLLAGKGQSYIEADVGTGESAGQHEGNRRDA